jgi:hypothetical protein
LFAVPPLHDPLAHPAKTCEVLQKVAGAIIPLAEIIDIILTRGLCDKDNRKNHREMVWIKDFNLSAREGNILGRRDAEKRYPKSHAKRECNSEAQFLNKVLC